MGDFKSKLPDLKELSQMTGKLFQDIKNSVCEIVAEYKAKHPASDEKTTESKTTDESVTKTTMPDDGTTTPKTGTSEEKPKE